VKIRREAVKYTFGTAALLIVPFSEFMPKALTPLFILAAFSAAVLEMSQPTIFRRPFNPFFSIFTAFILLFLISWTWTISPYDTKRLILPITGIFLLGIIMVGYASHILIHEIQFIRRAIVIGLVAGLALIVIEITTPIAITTFLLKLFKGENVWIETREYTSYVRNAANISALVIFPAIAIIWQNGRKVSAVLLLLLTMIILYFSNSGGAFLAVFAGIIAMVIALTTRKYTRIIFNVIFIIFIFALPISVSQLPAAGELEERFPNLPNSIYPRIFVWQASANYIFQAPILGKGFNSSRAISKPADRVEFFSKGKNPRASVPIPLHPHSAVLQIWLELGILGILLFVVFLTTLTKQIEISTLPGITRAIAYGSLISAFTIANLSYGIWQNWWLSGLWLIATFTVIAVRKVTVATKHATIYQAFS
jgi:exopolysaccharide production protein ExoQ